VELHMSPQADLCRRQASTASYRLSGTSDGRRDRCRIFFMIFTLPGTRGLGDFRLLRRLEPP
jgi:hypothetical protein